MLSSDIANIERATITAVSPYAVEELPSWLLPFNTGTVGRAISTVPLKHDFEQDAEALVAQIDPRYAAHGFKAAFRLSDGVSFEPLKQHLTQFSANGLRPRL